jgi:hypothetical protein
MENIESKYAKLANWDKVEFIKKLELEEQADKWNLFNSIIIDENDFDLSRIEVLKILCISQVPNDIKEIISDSIISVITSTKDYDIKNYATSAMENFTEFPKIRYLVRNIIFDITEDVDIRYNAFSAMQKIPDIKERIQILKNLLQDSVFHKSSQRILSELGIISF